MRLKISRFFVSNFVLSFFFFFWLKRFVSGGETLRDLKKDLCPQRVLKFVRGLFFSSLLQVEQANLSQVKGKKGGYLVFSDQELIALDTNAETSRSFETFDIYFFIQREISRVGQKNAMAKASGQVQENVAKCYYKIVLTIYRSRKSLIQVLRDSDDRDSLKFCSDS